MQNFAAAKNFRKFRFEIRRQSHRISRAAACQHSAQCLRTCKDRSQAAARGAQRISARFRAPNVVAAENFRKFRSEIRRESHQISRAASICGQLTDRGRSVNRSARAAQISARSRAISNAKILRSRKSFENFGPKSAPNRTQSHAAQHADARHRCWGPLRVVSELHTTKRHGFRRDLTRFRTRNFAIIRENFSKFSVRNPLQIARKLTRRSVPTLRTVFGDL